MTDEKKTQWCVVWEGGDGPEVDGPFANESTALAHAYIEWVHYTGGIVGGYNTGSRHEFDLVYDETDKLWIVPLGAY